MRADLEAGGRLGVNSRPTVLVNGRMLTRPQTYTQMYETFVDVVEQELARAAGDQ